MAGRLQRVLLLDGVDPVCGEVLAAARLDVTTRAKLTREQLMKEFAEHDCVVVRSATKVTAEVMAASERLRVVGRAGTGVDNIDVAAATRRGVIVMNTPGGNTLSAAEHTCAMICALSRHIPQACAALKEGRWDRKSHLGSELHGKTLAIVGLGRIGREVAKRMQAFGMTTIGYDPVIPKEVSAEWGVASLPLAEVWPRADYVTVHTPLLPHTTNLINDAVFAAAKPGVRIINVARGGIVDEAALLRALEAGTCGGAALDVFLEEPPTNLALCQHPKVICTPHLGANTAEAQRRVALEMATQLVDLVEGRRVGGLVNAPALAHAASEMCRPWVELAQALGCLANTLPKPAGDPAPAITVDLYGAGVSQLRDLAGPAVLVGLLKGMAQNGINLVNAPLLAKERGISLAVAAHPDSPPPLAAAAPEALQVTLTRGAATHTLLGNTASGQASLYALDGCVWETGVTLGRNMLFFSAPPAASPLAAIAAGLLAERAAVTSLLSSSPTTKEAWHVARTEAAVTLAASIPNTKLVAQVTF